MQASSSLLLERSKTSVEELQPVRSVEDQPEDLFSWFAQELQRRWVDTSLALSSWQEVRPAFSIETSILTEIERLLSGLRNNQVHLSESEQIVEYLLQFPDVLDVIPLAVRSAQKYFPEAQLVLSLYRDPEAEDRYLALYVRLKRYDESVIERIETAEAEFLDYLSDKEGWLQLTTDFREPEAEDAL